MSRPLNSNVQMVLKLESEISEAIGCNLGYESHYIFDFIVRVGKFLRS